MTSTRPSTARNVLLVAYAVALGWILLSPAPTAGSTGVDLVTDVLGWMSVPTDAATARTVEIALNVALFAPLPLVAHHLRPGWRLPGWTAVGLLISVGVEIAQYLLLPSRSGDPVDVLANAAGCALGAIVGAMTWERFSAETATADLGGRP